VRAHLDRGALKLIAAEAREIALDQAKVLGYRNAAGLPWRVRNQCVRVTTFLSQVAAAAVAGSAAAVRSNPPIASAATTTRASLKTKSRRRS
jgi:hypothetical protein